MNTITGNTQVYYLEHSMPIPETGSWEIFFAGPTLESKGMGAIFQKKGKIFENLSKKVQILKILWKRADDCVQ